MSVARKLLVFLSLAISSIPLEEQIKQIEHKHWWKKGLQSRFVKAINPGFRNRD
jgi:hypothetical protein